MVPPILLFIHNKREKDRKKQISDCSGLMVDLLDASFLSAQPVLISHIIQDKGKPSEMGSTETQLSLEVSGRYNKLSHGCSPAETDCFQYNNSLAQKNDIDIHVIHFAASCGVRLQSIVGEKL